LALIGIYQYQTIKTPIKMKTISTLFFSIFTLATVHAKEIASNLEITGTAVIPAASLTTGTNGNMVVLNFSAKNETSNSRYEIERSFYSNDFTTIATMQAPFANSNSISNYRINDNAAELAGRSIAYYRVKYISANGTITYSNVMVVKLNTEKSNFVRTNTSINFSAVQNGNAIIRVKSITGQTAATINSIITKGNNTVELNNLADLTKGIYVTEVLMNGVVVNNQKIIVE
jgi:hypothetical protein